MDPFTYTANPMHVRFGNGVTSDLPTELNKQKLHAALLLCTPHQAEQAFKLQDLLGSACVGIFSRAQMHTPGEITEEAVQTAKDLGADSVISFGGGSTIGLGKAISFYHGLPHICIVTTYAGSEMTPILGETRDGIKTTRRDPKILPRTVFYDVEHTLTLSPQMSATSGLNAMAHAVEALYAPDTNPIIRSFAKDGIRALYEALPVVVKPGLSQDRNARSRALYGAWLCGACLGTTSMSLHHKLCHTLGGSFNLPHAETHAILLPHTLAYNSKAVPSAMQDIGDALGVSQAEVINTLNGLLDKLGVQRSLKNLGMKESDIARAAEIAMKNQYSNPRKLEKDSIQEVIRRAWAGESAKAGF